MRKSIFFRADGNSSIGLGHITRCIALAEILKDDFEVNFIIKSPSEEIKKNISKVTSKLVVIDEVSNIEEISLYSGYLKPDDIIVLDGYNFDTNYQLAIKKTRCKMVCIDDIHKYHFVSDAIINHNPAVHLSDYSLELYTKLYSGFDYALLRKEFIEQAKKYRIIKDFDTLFICVGGADPNNLTYKFLSISLNLNFFKKIIIVTGSAYSFNDKLNKLVNVSNIPVLHLSNLNVNEMINVMCESQVAICPASSISLEVFCVGLNLITGYFVENQKQLANYIHKAQLGYSIGDFNMINDDELKKSILDNIYGEFYKRQKKCFKGNQIQNLKNIFHSL
ncbi:MAG: UDP-2,4-diacetamido-2,4,6-trideoxy-beta-L-altropyranose hydrolase [Cytophagaceae bacterium]|nr:UDP-2,4-diacetamido-2,4,6-trideoxy-beta-L-altropyranose hydrolase [Cytophagaceae bacterium]